MQAFFDQLGPIGAVLLDLLAALLILVIGYVIARVVASAVRRLLKRMNLDNQLLKTLGAVNEGSTWRIEDVAAKVVFWLIMLFVIVAMLQQLNLPTVASPINSLLERITTVYLPRLGGAALLLVVAWAVASILKYLTGKALTLLRVDERLSKYAALEDEERVTVSDSLATAVFWFILLFFLPPVLTQLGISQVAAPIENIFNLAIGYIPNIFAAALTLLIGWFVARVVRQIVGSLIAAVGADTMGQRVGLTGEQSISKLTGTFLYTLILLLALVSALEQLDIAAVSTPATVMLTTLLNALPNILGALLVLLISYFIGRLISRLIADLMNGVGFNTVPQKLGITWTGTRTPSDLVGYLILVGIMLFAALSATELLGSIFLSGILTTFIGFAGQLMLALIIFAIGLYLANLARTVILSAGGQRANMSATLARLAIWVLTGAMALRQLGVANDIVNLAFGILLGALGIAAALAIGLGSRDIAGREVERLLSAIRPSQDNE
ncbi:MAG: hypothetical protein DWQ04_29875 [Chloroflexi bacterium]|nr:MAG: hypothetical protein DWQ04_29875 [Chloroflexota bacterium]